MRFTYDGIGNGNVIGPADGVNGMASAQYEYEPFGELIRATRPMCKTNVFRCPIKATDDDRDFVYYGYEVEPNCDIRGAPFEKPAGIKYGDAEPDGFGGWREVPSAK